MGIRDYIGFSLAIALGLLIAGLIGASTGTGLSPGKCTSYVIDSTADDWYVATSGRSAIVQLEADTGSTGSGTEISVYCCTDEASNECAEYYWDSDDDGARDAYIMTGSSWPNQERQIRISDCAGVVLFDTTAYSDDGKLVVCGADY